MVCTPPVMMWLNSTHPILTGRSYRATASGLLSFTPPGKFEKSGGETSRCVGAFDFWNSDGRLSEVRHTQRYCGIIGCVSTIHFSCSAVGVHQKLLATVLHYNNLICMIYISFVCLLCSTALSVSWLTCRCSYVISDMFALSYEVWPLQELGTWVEEGSHCFKSKF